MKYCCIYIDIIIQYICLLICNAIIANKISTSDKLNLNIHTFLHKSNLSNISHRMYHIFQPLSDGISGSQNMIITENRFFNILQLYLKFSHNLVFC